MPAAARLVVAIDGPSGAGKSTVARAVAARLGLRYLDTGAMYRALTHRALADRVDLEDAEALTALAERTVLGIGTRPDCVRISADGTDLSAEIRSRAVSNAVSAVSAVPGVRARLVRLQREIIGAGGIVVEGRDIGTVVAPDAQVKIFLTASSAARANRRHRELADVGVALTRTREEIDRRDRLDSARDAAPLQRAPGAIELDSTRLTPEEVVEAVLSYCPAAC